MEEVSRSGRTQNAAAARDEENLVDVKLQDREAVTLPTAVQAQQ